MTTRGRGPGVLTTSARKRVVRVFLASLAALLLPTVAAPSAGASGGATCSGVPWDRMSPCVTFTPEAAPVGTVVRFAGQIPDHSTVDWATYLRDGGGLNSLDVPGARCILESGGVSDWRVTIASRGRFHGSFLLSAGRFGCHQSAAGQTDLYRPGLYALQAGCVVCEIGVLRITSGSLPFTGSRSQLTLMLVLAVALIAAGTTVLATSRSRPHRPAAL
jgi:hypothetical protein